MAENALIVGAGSGLSAALARLFAKEGMKVALAARNTDKLGALAKETGARVFTCDASKRDEVEALFAAAGGRSTSSSSIRARARAARSPSSIPTRC